MSEQDDEVGLGAVLEQFRHSLQEELHTAIPGRVESYDIEAQTADVRPMIRAAIPRRGGGVLSEELPTIRAVPVVHPRWGDFSIHAPLAAGDSVLLIMCERDIARWRQTGQISDPLDRRAHHLAHAVAIPGLYPRTGNLGADARPADAMVIGRVAGEVTTRIVIGTDGVVTIDASQIRLGSPDAADGVALASKVNEQVDAITAALDALANGAPVANDGGLALQTAFKVAWPGAPVAAPANVGSTKVSAE
jgi:hypothetical protein